jgi:hypothetical protein
MMNHLLLLGFAALRPQELNIAATAFNHTGSEYTHALKVIIES